MESNARVEDKEFYNSLRDQVDQYTELLSLSEDAKETKTILTEWKAKIHRLEENLKMQDGAMKEVLQHNEELETQVAKLSGKEKLDTQLSLGLPGVPSMPPNLVEENKDLGIEVDRMERSLAAARSENEALHDEIRRAETLHKQQEEEIKTLRSDLEVNRRIVHTKRELLQKEMTDEFKKETRKELEERLTIELTAKITEEVETRLKAEKEKELKDLRHTDEVRVCDVESQIPVLENEIDRLRKELAETKVYHEEVVKSMRERHQDKIESIVENFTDDKKREGSGYSQRIEALMIEIKENKEIAAKEKEESVSKAREEVKTEMQKEVQFLAVRVTQLTKELIEVVEKMKKEKELHGESIREELTKERDDLLEESAKAKEMFTETIAERDEAISKIMAELDEVTMERESLLAQVREEEEDLKLSDELQKEVDGIRYKANVFENERDLLKQRLGEVETDLQSTKESYAKDTEELETLRLKLDLSKSDLIKLTNQRDELIIMAEEFKNDCVSMSKEMKKIKGHFKFAVLVEYEEKIIELENELRRLKAVIEESKEFNAGGMEKISEQSLQLEQYKLKEQEMEANVKRLTEAVLSSVSELELKEERITELKEILKKKEIEATDLNETANQLQRNLNASENELTRLRDEQELSKEKMKSTKAYREQIAALTQELADNKSKLAQETSTQEKESKLLRGRIQRMNDMLREAENVQRQEKSSFEQAKLKLDKSLLASTNEVKALHSEVSRLKNLLDLSRKSSNNDDSQAKTPRMNNKRQSAEVRIQKELQKELLQNIAAAERATNDLKKYRSESEVTIRTLQDELRRRDDEKRKMEKELHDNKKLLKEAVMSWRVETRSLKKQLDQSRTQNILDVDSEIMSEESSKSPENLRNADKWGNKYEQRKNSIPLPFVIKSVSTKQNSEIRDDVEDGTDSFKMESTKDIQLEEREKELTTPTKNTTLSKMLDISESTSSIEMKFDQKKNDPPGVTGDEQSLGEVSEGEQRERDHAEAIYNSLQEFKKEYKQYVNNDDFDENIGNSYSVQKSSLVLGSINQISADSQNANSNKNEDQRSVSSSGRGDYTSEEDTRDGNSVRPSKISFRSQQTRLFATESDDASSKDMSEKTTASERSRALRKKMSDLLEIKNNIRVRASAQVAADTNGRVAKQPQQKQEKEGAPWGISANANPKLYRFLESKSSDKYDAPLSSLPSDENSKLAPAHE